MLENYKLIDSKFSGGKKGSGDKDHCYSLSFERGSKYVSGKEVIIDVNSCGNKGRLIQHNETLSLVSTLQRLFHSLLILLHLIDFPFIYS